MDKELIERYKAEMLRTYNSRTLPDTAEQNDVNYDDTGHLLVSVTTLKGFYPLPRATVKVFTGSVEDMTVIDTDITDESGQTKLFSLPAPSRELSQSTGATEAVYTSYNVLVEADGYVDEINLNLPIFRGVTSLQNVDMILRSVSNNQNTIINDQNENYNL